MQKSFSLNEGENGNEAGINLKRRQGAGGNGGQASQALGKEGEEILFY